jgi:hypothetical protein
MRLHRIAPPFEAKPHLDLYHPLARLYRGAIATRASRRSRASCAAWRASTTSPAASRPRRGSITSASGRTGSRPCFRHNELDVLSLVTLAAHLGRARREAARGRQLAARRVRARARAVAELHAGRREHALGPRVAGARARALRQRRGRAVVPPRRVPAQAGRARRRALDGFLRLARERRDAPRRARLGRGPPPRAAPEAAPSCWRKRVACGPRGRAHAHRPRRSSRSRRSAGVRV